MKKRIYFENLDGLRFFCFLSVFFFHSFHTDYQYIKDTTTYYLVKHQIFGNGDLGVNFFFVLSGFLITYLLIEEKKLNGQIDLKRFWLRRVLRIWPLFYACVFFGFIIFPQLKIYFGQIPNETANPFYYLTFINNFDYMRKGVPDSSILGILWSVAIEEQFYLLWPVILYMFPIKRYWIAFSIIIISSLIFRSLHDSYPFHAFHTLSCIGDMTIGAFGAWLISETELFRTRIENLSKLKIGLIYLSFVVIYLFRNEVLLANYWIRIFERSIIASIILLIILEQNYSKKSFFKLSKFKTISKLGMITYGLYCLHFIGILIVTQLTDKFLWNTSLWQVMILRTTLSLVLAIFIAKISYKYLETPFLKVKNRFSPFTQ